MAPNATASMSNPATNMRLTEEPDTISDSKSERKEYRREIVWGNVFKFAVLHVLGLHALVLLPSVTAKTMAFSLLCFLLGGLVSADLRKGHLEPSINDIRKIIGILDPL